MPLSSWSRRGTPKRWKTATTAALRQRSPWSATISIAALCGRGRSRSAPGTARRRRGGEDRRCPPGGGHRRPRPAAPDRALLSARAAWTAPTRLARALQDALDRARGGDGKPELSSCQAIASAPTCAHGCASRRSRDGEHLGLDLGGGAVGDRCGARGRHCPVGIGRVVAPHPARDPLPRASQRARDRLRRLARQAPPHRLTPHRLFASWPMPSPRSLTSCRRARDWPPGDGRNRPLEPICCRLRRRSGNRSSIGQREPMCCRLSAN